MMNAEKNNILLNRVTTSIGVKIYIITKITISIGSEDNTI